MEFNKVIQEITDKLKGLFFDTPIIALAGAHAKGVADVNSDIDIFVFGNSPRPFDDRKKIIEGFCDNPDNFFISENFDFPWGGSIDFRYKNIPIEVVVRLISKTEEIVSQCIEGKFDIIPQTWTSNGYYSYIYLSEIDFLKPIYDEQKWLYKLKTKVEKYPQKLKHNIISTFLCRASTWIDNFHYSSAIKRKDILFVAPIIIHTLLDMIQVIFAINEVYFTGDKKLEKVLLGMPYCPETLLKNINFLLTTNKDEDTLNEQARILKDIYYELRSYVNV